MPTSPPRIAVAVAVLGLTACGGGGSSAPAPVGVTATATPTPGPTATASAGAVVQPQLANSALIVSPGFTARVIATVNGARELAALPNGDLLVGENGTAIAIVPNAEAAGVAGTPTTFATMNDADAAGVAYAPNGAVYVGTTNGVWKLGYTPGAQTPSSITKIASVRTGSLSPNPDDQHTTTSVVATSATLYAGVGSDCDACAETDPTRATIQQMHLDGTGMTTKATRFRNPIALAVDPSGTMWAGGAGPDYFPYGHPYEYFDDVSAHAGVVDYGWPVCYENAQLGPNAPAGSCSGVTTPAIEFPAYSTLIGAAFYPVAPSGPYAFPAAYRGGVFVTAHGSWHDQTNSTLSYSQPNVFFVPFSGTQPTSPVDWMDPLAQSQAFFTNFGTSSSNRIGRPTGIAVGPQGSLFIGDDETGAIYRIRPTASEAQSAKRSAR